MKVKEGDVLVCEIKEGCGIEVKVIRVCGCDECDLVCCGKQMTKKKKTIASECSRQEPCCE